MAQTLIFPAFLLISRRALPLLFHQAPTDSVNLNVHRGFVYGDCMAHLAEGEIAIPRIARIEWPTVALAFLIYGGFIALTYFWRDIPLLILVPLGAWLIAWHGSLQHEVIHHHPTR
ncbi:MAG: hypothetical protein ACK4ZJ_15580, partial [Allorhizobium sp.]